MHQRLCCLAGLCLWLSCLAWATPGRAQDTRFEQTNPAAERDWQEQIRRHPGNATAYFNLGRHYEMTRRIPLAAKNYQKATQLKPGWPEAFFYLGKALREMSRPQEAAAALERAVTLRSNYAIAYHYLGLVKISLGRIQEAAEALLHAYDINPGWAETYYDNTTYGMANELGDKGTVLAMIKFIYPVNQHFASILYKRWARNNAGMKEYWETVSGRKLPGDKGYQEETFFGYQEPEETGYQKAEERGFHRKSVQPNIPDLAD